MEREWTFDLEFEVAQVRCRFLRQGKDILEYTVQLELWHEQIWNPVIRYDNAHGFCHYDTIHPDGTQDKTSIYRGDANTNFTWAIQEIRANWKAHCSRYIAEVKS
jgi:hypothetical protein